MKYKIKWKSKTDHIDDSKQHQSRSTIDVKLKNLLKYGTYYADSHPVCSPVGTPLELFDITYFGKENSWKEDGINCWYEPIDWKNLMAKDPVQIPDTRNREGYNNEDHLGFWISGYNEYCKTLAAIEAHNLHSGRYFDFGGSTGRVFRHFAFQSDKWDVWSSDFKLDSVEWNQLYYPSSIKVFLNNNAPSLPLPDNYFDLVTAYSVFTHINESETTWLLELRRILKVGGIAYISIHDEATWANPKPNLWETVKEFRPDIADFKEMPIGKTVVTFRNDDPYHCNVFHSREYIEKIWQRYFKICEIKSSYHGTQAVVICRRTS